MRLGEPDRLTVTGTLRSLNERHGRVQAAIASRIRTLGEAIDNFRVVRFILPVDILVIKFNELQSLDPLDLIINHRLKLKITKI